MKMFFVLFVCLLWKESNGYHIAGCVNGVLKVDLTSEEIIFVCTGIGREEMTWVATLRGNSAFSRVSTCPFAVNSRCRQPTENYKVIRSPTYEGSEIVSALKVLRTEVLVQGGTVGCGPNGQSDKRTTTCSLDLILATTPIAGQDSGGAVTVSAVTNLTMAMAVVLSVLVIALIASSSLHVWLCWRRRQDKVARTYDFPDRLQVGVREEFTDLRSHGNNAGPNAATNQESDYEIPL